MCHVKYSSIIYSTAERTTSTQVEHEQFFIVKTSQRTRQGWKHHFLLQNELRGAEAHTSVTPGIHPGVFGFHCHVLVSVLDTSMVEYQALC